MARKASEAFMAQLEAYVGSQVRDSLRGEKSITTFN